MGRRRVRNADRPDRLRNPLSRRDFLRAGTVATLGLGLPATIDKVSIAVDTPVPGAAVTVVVYQDANGGSPVDATLIGQASVNIAAVPPR